MSFHRMKGICHKSSKNDYFNKEYCFNFFRYSFLNPFWNDRLSHRAAGDFLYITARRKGEFDHRERIKPGGKLTMRWRGIMNINRR